MRLFSTAVIKVADRNNISSTKQRNKQTNMSSLEDLLSSAVQATLTPFLDEDICEYIQQTLAEDPHDEDARDNVKELLRGSIDGDADPEIIIAEFFEKLKLENEEDRKKKDEEAPLKKLEKTVTMKEYDIESYANGLTAVSMGGGDHEDEAISSIQDFYANMIDISNEAVMSERLRRKEKQKALRGHLEEAERKRAIQEAMDILKEEDTTDDNPEDFLNAATDSSADVHMNNLDLPNLRGGGPDLLRSASLTLARGRRYGLVRHQHTLTLFTICIIYSHKYHCL